MRTTSFSVNSNYHLNLVFPTNAGGYGITTDADAGLYEKYHETSDFDIPDN